MAQTRIRVETIPVELTPRLRAEADRWHRHGRRPETIEPAGPGQVSVWEFPRPPALERVLDPVTIELGGVAVASTEGALRVCETASPPTYYLPRSAFLDGCLVMAAGSSSCEWKGRARYWSLRHGGAVAEQAAWSYEDPFPEYAPLAGAIAVYPAAVDRCTVGSMIVRPQPGGYYGGWITADLVGPFKGSPGSSGW